MTPLIAASNDACTFQSTRPLAPPSSFLMPHVFVIPPVEEQRDNPPWCCFDADEQPENNDSIPSTSDNHFFDTPHLFQPSENDVPIPLSRRTSVYQLRPRAPMSKKLEKKQRPEAVKIIETKLSHSKQRDPREDSDVVEVVKVKRARESSMDLEENKKAKRSKTLKARATKALQSIKNVGKTSRRTHVKELWTSSESMSGTFKGKQQQIHSQHTQTKDSTLSKKGTLPRGRSLSQIFQPMKPSRVESSFTIRVSSSVSPAEAHHNLPAAHPSSLSNSRDNNTNPSFDEVPSTLTTDDGPYKPVSPLPSARRNNNLTKLSVRELHRLFSFSSSSPDDPSSSPTAAVGPSLSAHDSSKHSTPSPLSRDYLDVPMEDDIFADAHLVDLESPERRAASRYQASYTPYRSGLSTPRRRSDVSFEMKLDSLHFDSLSFDPDDFDASREGTILR